MATPNPGKSSQLRPMAALIQKIYLHLFLNFARYFLRIKSTVPPIINNAIPHQRESPGSILSNSVTIPEVISDHPTVVRYFMIYS